MINEEFVYLDIEIDCGCFLEKDGEGDIYRLGCDDIYFWRFCGFNCCILFEREFDCCKFVELVIISVYNK